MHGLGGHQGLRHTKAENGREAAAEGPAEARDEHRQPMPCVVRGLSREVARYLDPEGS